VSLSWELPETAGADEDGRRGDRRLGDEGDGEKAPGTEDRLGVGSTLRVVPAKCSISESGSMK
jgi:hypothetical protein